MSWSTRGSSLKWISDIYLLRDMHLLALHVGIYNTVSSKMKLLPRSLLQSVKKRALFSGFLTWTNFVKNENSLRIRVQTISIFNQSYSTTAVTSQVEFAFKVFQHREAPEAHELKNIALVISRLRFLEIEDSVELEIILTTGII